MTLTPQSLPSRQLHHRPGSPMNGVLEGREPLAGGATKSRSETTGSHRTPAVLSRRAPAGAREAVANRTFPFCVRLSRPSRALPSPTMGAHRDPVVAPPAHFFRASGTTGSRDHFRDVTKMLAASVAGYGVATNRRPSGCLFGDDSSPFPTSSPVSLPR